MGKSAPKRGNHKQAPKRVPKPLDVIASVAGRTRASVGTICSRKPSEVVAWGVRYVANNFDKGITLDDFAGGLGLSKFHFLRRFRDEAGITPGMFLQLYRIAEAMERLAYSDRAIREIAREVGYRNAAAFSRAFHKVAGTQPRRYRRTRQKAASAAAGS